jgi:hypothetical protein
MAIWTLATLALDGIQKIVLPRTSQEFRCKKLIVFCRESRIRVLAISGILATSRRHISTTAAVCAVQSLYGNESSEWPAFSVIGLAALDVESLQVPWDGQQEGRTGTGTNGMYD